MPSKIKKHNKKESKIKKKDIPLRPQSDEILDSIKVKNPKKKAIILSHIQKYDELTLLLDHEIDRRSREREKGVKLLQTIRKKVNKMNVEFRRIEKIKRKRGGIGGGLVSKSEVTDELADFLKISSGSQITRNEITNAICVYCHLIPDEKRPQMLVWEKINPKGKRDLQDPNNKSIIIPDKKLSKLLNYKKYIRDVNNKKITENKVNKETNEKEVIIVTDPSLKYYVMQKLISKQIISIKKVEVKKE